MELKYGLDQIKEVSNFILKNVTSKTLLVCGEVGAGKTTLIKELCKKLKVEETVSSPTYTVINEYKSNNDLVIHMDLYRIENIEDINHLGLFEYIDKYFVIIEWPEIIINDLDCNHSILKIEYLNKDKRKINLTNITI